MGGAASVGGTEAVRTWLCRTTLCCCGAAADSACACLDCGAASRRGTAARVRWAARTREVRRGHAMPAPIRHRALGEPVAIATLPMSCLVLSHCGAGSRHLGETVGSRCRGVARAVAPFTRWCHLGRVGAEVILQGLVALSLIWWRPTLSENGDASRAGRGALVCSLRPRAQKCVGEFAPQRSHRLPWVVICYTEQGRALADPWIPRYTNDVAAMRGRQWLESL